MPPRRTTTDVDTGADTRSATEIAADAAKDAQPIDLPQTRRVDNDTPRAERRGVYVDDNDPLRRVVVAAGDPVPPGFSLESDSPIGDRAAATPTVHPGIGADATPGAGGAEGDADKGKGEDK